MAGVPPTNTILYGDSYKKDIESDLCPARESAAILAIL
jgi:hypothetical protein